MPQLPPQVRKYLAAIGRQGGLVGGKSKSKVKATASRRNGRLGGRPRKGDKNENRNLRQGQQGRRKSDD